MSEIRVSDIKELAKEDYFKGMKYKELAEKYGVTLNTIKSWKQRYEWDRKSVHTKSKKGAHKRGAPKGNKNAVGNLGGSAPEQNKNAEKHGFFSKWLPEETLKIMNEIETKSPIDLLWDNIMIQYAAIIRAQRIMHVTAKDEMIKELKKEKRKSSSKSTEKTNSSNEEIEIEYEFQFAWDRHATFLQAQSRAMAELRNMMKRYEEMLNSGLATEEQKLRIEKLKVDIEKVKYGEDDTESKLIDDWVEAVTEDE